MHPVRRTKARAMIFTTSVLTQRKERRVGRACAKPIGLALIVSEISVPRAPAGGHKPMVNGRVRRPMLMKGLAQTQRTSVTTQPTCCWNGRLFAVHFGGVEANEHSGASMIGAQGQPSV